MINFLTLAEFRGKQWWAEEEALMCDFFYFRKSKLRIKNSQFDELMKKKLAKRKPTKTANDVEGRNRGDGKEDDVDKQLEKQTAKKDVVEQVQGTEATIERKSSEEPKQPKDIEVHILPSTFGTVSTFGPGVAAMGELKMVMKSHFIQTKEEEVFAPVFPPLVQPDDLIPIMDKLSKLEEVNSQQNNTLEKLSTASKA